METHTRSSTDQESMYIYMLRVVRLLKRAQIEIGWFLLGLYLVPPFPVVVTIPREAIKIVMILSRDFRHGKMEWPTNTPAFGTKSSRIITHNTIFLFIEEALFAFSESQTSKSKIEGRHVCCSK